MSVFPLPGVPGCGANTEYVIKGVEHDGNGDSVSSAYILRPVVRPTVLTDIFMETVRTGEALKWEYQTTEAKTLVIALEIWRRTPGGQLARVPPHCAPSAGATVDFLAGGEIPIFVSSGGYPD